MVTPANVDLPMDVAQQLNESLEHLKGKGNSGDIDFKLVDSANGSELSDLKESEKTTPREGDQGHGMGPPSAGGNVPFMGLNPYVSLLNKAKLDIDGNLDQIMYDWTPEESTCRRRLVQFWRRHENNHIICGFKPVANAERVQNSIVVSCIYWDDKSDFFITSVDCIYLLEALIGVRFTVEEKNRIRRNLEGFRPLTVSKSKEDSVAFFKLIMSFPSPKPRNIEKDVKVFYWRVLAFALKKIISKYTASYSTTASISLETYPGSALAHTANSMRTDKRAQSTNRNVFGGNEGMHQQAQSQQQHPTGMYSMPAVSNPLYLQSMMMLQTPNAALLSTGNGQGPNGGAQDTGTPDYLQQYRLSEQQRRFSTSVLAASNVSQWLQQQMQDGSANAAVASSYMAHANSNQTINPIHLHASSNTVQDMSRYLSIQQGLSTGQQAQVQVQSQSQHHQLALNAQGMPDGNMHPAYLATASMVNGGTGFPADGVAQYIQSNTSGSNANDPMLGTVAARRHSVADPYNAEYSLQHQRRAMAMMKAFQQQESHGPNGNGSVNTANDKGSRSDTKGMSKNGAVRRVKTSHQQQIPNPKIPVPSADEVVQQQLLTSFVMATNESAETETGEKSHGSISSLDSAKSINLSGEDD
ncbi:hypothetical protein IWQ61_002741, partial [Dispira simplex]